MSRVKRRELVFLLDQLWLADQFVVHAMDFFRAWTYVSALTAMSAVASIGILLISLKYLCRWTVCSRGATSQLPWGPPPPRAPSWTALIASALGGLMGPALGVSVWELGWWKANRESREEQGRGREQSVSAWTETAKRTPPATAAGASYTRWWEVGCATETLPAHQDAQAGGPSTSLQSPGYRRDYRAAIHP